MTGLDSAATTILGEESFSSICPVRLYFYNLCILLLLPSNYLYKYHHRYLLITYLFGLLVIALFLMLSNHTTHSRLTSGVRHTETSGNGGITALCLQNTYDADACLSVAIVKQHYRVWSSGPFPDSQWPGAVRS